MTVTVDYEISIRMLTQHNQESRRCIPDLVSRAIRILRVLVGGARKGKGGGGKIRMVYLYRFLCVSAGMLAAPIRLQQA